MIKETKKRKRGKSSLKPKAKKVHTVFPVLKCPITLKPFEHPTFLSHDGLTYEKEKLVAWYRKRDQWRTPMGIPTPVSEMKHGFFQHMLTKNKALTQNFPYLGPITRENMKDPMILVKSGETYEHEALRRAIQETICKGKLLFGEFAVVSPKPNKILWLVEHAAERKAFQIPPLKVYTGFDKKKLKGVKPEVLNGAAFTLFKLKNVTPKATWIGGKHENRFLQNCHFFGSNNCFKEMLFENCLFDQCFFDTCCMCSKFKNCMFQNCLFTNLSEHTLMQVQGSSFVNCRINSKNTLFNMSKDFDVPAPKIHHHYQDTQENCTLLDELHRCLSFRRAKKIQFRVI